MNQRTPSWSEQRQMKRKMISNNLKIKQDQKVIDDYYKRIPWKTRKNR